MAPPQNLTLRAYVGLIRASPKWRWGKRRHLLVGGDRVADVGSLEKVERENDGIERGERVVELALGRGGEESDLLVEVEEGHAGRRVVVVMVRVRPDRLARHPKSTKPALALRSSLGFPLFPLTVTSATRSPQFSATSRATFIVMLAQASLLLFAFSVVAPSAYADSPVAASSSHPAAAIKGLHPDSAFLYLPCSPSGRCC